MNIKKQFIILTALSISSNVCAMASYNVSHENIKDRLLMARASTLKEFFQMGNVYSYNDLDSAAAYKANSIYHHNALLVAAGTTALASPLLHIIGKRLASMAPTMAGPAAPEEAGFLTILVIGMHYIESIPSSLSNSLSQSVGYSLPFLACFGTAGMGYLYYKSGAIKALAKDYKTALIGKYQNKLNQELVTLKNQAHAETFNTAINNVDFRPNSPIFNGDRDLDAATQQVLATLRTNNN